MNYSYDVHLHGTWIRHEVQDNEVGWFIRRLQEPSDGAYSYRRLPHKDTGRQVKRPFEVISITTKARPRDVSSWRPVDRSGTFELRMTQTASGPAQALSAAQKRVRDYLDKVMCTPPTLTFL